MAESKKSDSSSVNVKEKDVLKDLDIENDFITSWKSMSMADGDALDFDLTPASKGNKKPFDFGKEDMDFNFDDDFGKMPFNMDMSDLDISPPLKKDGKSKEKSKESSSGKDTRSSFDMDMPDLDISLPLKRGDKSKEKPQDSSSRKHAGSSFNMDMSDLDISPPLKKDGKSKEKSKESSSGKDTGSSFNMDMPDLDISPPLKRDKSKAKPKDPSSRKHTGLSFNMDMSDLDISSPFKKDGKSKEKSKEPSSGKDTEKIDRFAFALDFDELDNLGFGPSLTKEDSKAQSVKYTKGSSPKRGDCQDKDVSTHMNVITSMSTLEDGPQKPSLPETRINFDMDCLVGGSVNLEPTRKSCYSNSAMDDTVATEHSAAVGEVESDKTEVLPEKTIMSREVQDNGQSAELVPNGPVDVESFTGNDVIKELSSDYPSNTETSGGNSSKSQNKVDLDTNATGSNGKQDANVISVVGSNCSTLSKNSEDLQTVAISENINTKNSWDLVEDNVIDDRGKTVLGENNSLVGNPCTATAVSGDCCDSEPGTEDLESSRILKLSLVSQPDSLKEKQTKNAREPRVNSSLPSIQIEKPECPLLKVSAQATFSSLSSKKMGSAQPSLVEGRDGNTTQSDKRLGSRSLQHSKALLRGELPKIPSQENCNGVKPSGEMDSSDGLQHGKDINVSFATQIKDIVITKPAMRKRETSMKDLNTLSMDINKKAAKNREKPTTLTSIPTEDINSLEEHRLSSTEGSTKTPDLPKLKLTGLRLDSTKSPTEKYSKLVGSSNQKSTFLRKPPSDMAHFPNTQKQTPSTLSMKRMLEDSAANSIALHPSKRLSLSASTSRNLVETSEKVLNKKVPCHNHLEDHRAMNAVDKGQVMAINLPHEVNKKGVEISFSIQNDSNIKTADAYSKELDDLCNILRKKQDEAKEVLARAIVSSNKLLMLNNPRFQVKDMFASLTLNINHG